MIVGMNFGVVAQLTAKNLNGAVSNHLVTVHVEADTSAGLENIHDEFVVPLALLHFLGCLNNGIGDFLVYQAEFAVGFGRRLLDHAKDANQCGMGAHPGDRVILDGPRSLYPIIHICGDLFRAEGIFLHARGVLTVRGHDWLLGNRKL